MCPTFTKCDLSVVFYQKKVALIEYFWVALGAKNEKKKKQREIHREIGNMLFITQKSVVYYSKWLHSQGTEACIHIALTTKEI